MPAKVAEAFIASVGIVLVPMAEPTLLSTTIEAVKTVQMTVVAMVQILMAVGGVVAAVEVA